STACHVSNALPSLPLFTLSLHDALPSFVKRRFDHDCSFPPRVPGAADSGERRRPGRRLASRASGSTHRVQRPSGGRARAAGEAGGRRRARAGFRRARRSQADPGSRVVPVAGQLAARAARRRRGRVLDTPRRGVRHLRATVAAGARMGTAVKRLAPRRMLSLALATTLAASVWGTAAAADEPLLPADREVAAVLSQSPA